MAKSGISVRQAAEDLGVPAKWVRRHISAGTITPQREGGKSGGRFALTAAELVTLRERLSAKPRSGSPSTDTTALARITQLEADRANLLAQVAWSRAIAQEQQKAVEVERERADRLAAEVETQRARVEALKALTVIDRALGRHKSI